MNIGIVGLPSSGKTTVFNALTGQNIQTAGYSGSGTEINVAAVKVPDERLDWLVALYEPKKKVQVELKFSDFAPMQKGTGFSDRHIADLRNCDALIYVIRAFEDESVPHPDGKVNPASDMETLLMEFSLADLAVVEKRITRIRDSYIKMPKEEKAKADREKPILENMVSVLEEGGRADSVELSQEDEKLIKSYGLLTMKPGLIVINVGDDQIGKGIEKQLEGKVPEGMAIMELSGRLEMDIAQLETVEEQKEFLTDAGIEQPAAARVIQEAYTLVGLITFYTAGGKNEAAAWQLHKGGSALIAAGKIHSDIARGFIRAEVVAFNDIHEHGSESAVRSAGKFRLEGKEYVVADGDIIAFRFNV